MSDERRIELVNKLVDLGLDEAEHAELEALQKQPWEPAREPPIDVKNEIRMADLSGMMMGDLVNIRVEEAWAFPGYVVDTQDIEKLLRGDDPRTIGPKGVARRFGAE
jgi:hypothetical protein